MTPRTHLRPLTDAPLRAVIYLRQSTHRDDSISLELQEIACRDYCERMGYTVVDVRSDPGISGRTWSKRPDVQRAMAAIEDRTADVIVLWKWSRLSRSRRDWALAADRVDIAGGRIESATEPIDTATASGRFARGVMTEYAAFQSEQIGETWEEVRQRRLKRGLPASGRLPYGWRWIKGQGIEPDPEQALVVVSMYRQYLAGHGSAEIARALNAEGIPGPNGNPWTRARPLTVMDSPIHAGLIPYRGSLHAGAHEPIIDSSTWEAYRAERDRRRAASAKPRAYEYLLSTLVRCPCGARMTGKGSVTGGRWYGGYLCGSLDPDHAGGKYISALTLHPAVEHWILQFSPRLSSGGRSVDTQRARRDRILREMNELQAELTALARQNARGVLSDAAYAPAAASVEADLAALSADERAIHATTRAVPTAQELHSLRTAWPMMTTAAKNRSLRQMVDRIEVRSGGSVRLHTTWGTSSVLF